MIYAVTDIETAGYQPGDYPGITEVAIILFDGEKIIDTYQTLINPECSIQPYVTRLTGITDQMAQGAPVFAEVAQKINEFTRDAVFVAHAVNFDFTFLQVALRRCGVDFNRRKLCTVRLSRSIFPGYRSYSLDSICNHLQIGFSDRHRALGDAKATVLLLEKCLKHDRDGFIKKSLAANSKETILPPALKRKTFDTLPQTTGVYYFHNSSGKVIYVGKAINIKKRISGHFSSRKKRLDFFTDIADITYTLCGTELIAKLLEDSEIKKNFPAYNSAQKFPSALYILTGYTDHKGVQHLLLAKSQKQLHAYYTFRTFDEARAFMNELRNEFNLCPKYCNMQTSTHACFHFEKKMCNGVCAGIEVIDIYNARVNNAIAYVQSLNSSQLIIAEGRNKKERSVVVIEKGIYKGFGYFDASIRLNTIEEALPFIDLQNHTADIHSIISGVL